MFSLKEPVIFSCMIKAPMTLKEAESVWSMKILILLAIKKLRLIPRMLMPYSCKTMKTLMFRFSSNRFSSKSSILKIFLMSKATIWMYIRSNLLVFRFEITIMTTTKTHTIQYMSWINGWCRGISFSFLIIALMLSSWYNKLKKLMNMANLRTKTNF